MKEFSSIVLAAAFSFIAGLTHAAPPAVTLVNPRGPAAISPGDVVHLRAEATDSDGQVTHVEFFESSRLLGTATGAVFAVWWTNDLVDVPAGRNFIAVAIDDSLERATSAVVNVTSYNWGSRVLHWNPPFVSGPPRPFEWNMRDFNWGDGSRFTHFRAGDEVMISGLQRPVFIGVDGVPASVAPRRTSIYGGVVEGGDIISGRMSISDRVTFTNYGGSLSFPGGTEINGSLAYNIARAPHEAVVHFGTGPITFNGSNPRFEFDLMTNQFATIENDFGFSSFFTSPMSTINMGKMDRRNATARFTGTLYLGGYVNVEIFNGVGFWPSQSMARDPDSHEWAGPVVIEQNRPQRVGINVMGQNRSKAFLVSGNIKDGPGSQTNRLLLRSYGIPALRVSGSNTYAHGTLIEQTGPGMVEVAEESSLGFGGVEVDGTLRLMGSGNIHSNASVFIRNGRVILDSGVHIRLRQLTMGATYTSGIFTQTNSFGRILSNGTFRLPAVNLQPMVAITNPVHGATLPVSDTLHVQTLSRDIDSYIERVDLYVNGTLVGRRTNAPFDFAVSNPPLGQSTLEAVIHDDDSASTTSLPVTITMAPSIDAINYVETNQVAITFRTAGQPVALEATDSLIPSMWFDLGQFGGATTHVVTNATTDAPIRYFRLRTP